MYPNVDPPRDIFGREIKLGSYVVYGVYTRGGGLQHGTVEKLTVKGDIIRRRQNPVTGVWEDHKVPNWKISVRVPSTRYNSTTRKYEPCDRLQTLDTPRRFAIVKAPDE